MRRPFSTQTQIIDETIHDDAGKLIAQQVFRVSTSQGSAGSIHRTVKQIIQFQDTKSNSLKETVCAEAMLIFPDIAESGLLIKHLVSGIKGCLPETPRDRNEEKLEEPIQVPVMV